MELDEILKIAVKNNASDVHFRVGLPPMFRIKGDFVPLRDSPRITPSLASALAVKVMSKAQHERFLRSSELSTSYGVKGLGRFRTSVFRQRTTVALAMRVIPQSVSSFEELRLPDVVERVANSDAGLVLVTGPASCGKSTTLASVIDHINDQRTGHILTIEDPIEFMFRDKHCIVSQREVGVVVPNVASAIYSALRQDPDVIAIGELWSFETIRAAITAAASGRLVLATIATHDAIETVNQLVAAYPAERQAAARLQISNVLLAVISQRLVVASDHKTMLPVVEVLVSSPRIREVPKLETRLHELPDALIEGRESHGTQTFDQSLFDAVSKELLTRDEAHQYCSDPDEFALQFVNWNPR